MTTPQDTSVAVATALELSRVRRLAKSGEARRIRVLGDLTQAEIGEAIGVTGVAVSKWENGVNRPTGPAAIAYGRILAGIVEAHRGDDGDAC